MQIDLVSAISQKKTLIIALSGGADSVCLTHLLFVKKKIPLVLAHFNHHLRGIESNADEKFIRTWAAQLKLPLEIGHWQTPVKSEEKARQARYNFLRQIQKKHQAQGICTAHHQDDQVETILFNFIRGTGLHGLRGMLEWENGIYRPLLKYTKTEILKYCQKHKLKFCIDQSNFDTAFQRNFLRLEVIPQLKKINPVFSESICQNAQIFNELNVFLENSLQPFLKQNPLNLQAFLKLQPAQQSALIKIKIAQFTEPNFKKIQTILNLIHSQKTGKQKSFGKLNVRLEYNWIFFETKDVSAVNRKNLTKKLVLNTQQKMGEFVIEIKKLETKPLQKKQTSLYLDLDKIKLPLFVRTWQKGDFFQPNGLTGTQKLSDFFINQKIPQSLRKTLPLLLDAENQILAVGVLRLSQIATPTSATRQFLEFRIQTNSTN